MDHFVHLTCSFCSSSGLLSAPSDSRGSSSCYLDSSSGLLCLPSCSLCWTFGSHCSSSSFFRSPSGHFLHLLLHFVYFQICCVNLVVLFVHCLVHFVFFMVHFVHHLLHFTLSIFWSCFWITLLNFYTIWESEQKNQVKQKMNKLESEYSEPEGEQSNVESYPCEPE